MGPESRTSPRARVITLLAGDRFLNQVINQRSPHIQVSIELNLLLSNSISGHSSPVQPHSGILGVHIRPDRDSRGLRRTSSWENCELLEGSEPEPGDDD